MRLDSMDSVKKKVLLDLFVSPWTIVPIVGGLSAWLLSWGIDGNATLNLIGLAGVMAGVGIQATRLIFGIEELTEKAYAYLTEQEKAAQDQRLAELSTRLENDGDPRSEECLRRLRRLYDSLDSGAPKGATAIMFRDKVEELFRAAVRQLERSLELWERSQQLPGNVGSLLLKERRKAIDEVVLTVNHVTRTVEQYHAFQMKESDHELAKLREELDQTIQAARRADEAINAIGKPQYDGAEYE